MVFFRRKFDPDTTLATYVIALPIKVDVSKYIPPMFAGKMQDAITHDLAGFAFPPYAGEGRRPGAHPAHGRGTGRRPHRRQARWTTATQWS